MFGNNCPRSHDLDVILDQQEAEEQEKKRQESSKKRFRKSNGNDASSADVVKEADIKPVVLAVLNGTSDSNSTTSASPSSSSSSVPSKRMVPVKLSLPKSSSLSSKSTTTNTTAIGSAGDDGPNNSFETYHSAHFDAYMTAFVFARQKQAGLVSSDTLLADPTIGDPKNKLYLMGKPIPLRIEKSSFVKYSKGHTERWEQLKKDNIIN
jgi:target of EGR1 protein 1